MKKQSCSALQCSACYSAEPSVLGGVSYVCYMCSAIVFWLLFPSVQSFAEALFAYVGSVYSLAGVKHIILTRYMLVCIYQTMRPAVATAGSGAS